jgi:hypothetical protein
MEFKYVVRNTASRATSYHPRIKVIYNLQRGMCIVFDRNEPMKPIVPTNRYGTVAVMNVDVAVAVD